MTSRQNLCGLKNNDGQSLWQLMERFNAILISCLRQKYHFQMQFELARHCGGEGEGINILIDKMLKSLSK